eukprot:CAMPEP_0174256704 /NCGR_PEP_ID=MMETSP0439-20130205/5907_1 /TAXON_ID=0 /ORGANISM="Stereomyxa ramosa, Strain Chinc5" /LENGTH=492 /DNA_ID=CAMNT_0015339431 /DNA_START=158 /DNA_END=1636 /DNA_ORIENTATION=+
MAHYLTTMFPPPQTDGILVFKGNRGWHKGSKTEQKNIARELPVRFKDVWSDYGTVVEYVRVGLVIVGAFGVGYHARWVGVVTLLMCYLLGWEEGPLTRTCGRHSVFGGGLAWLADLQAQALLMVWWCTLDGKALPWLMVVGTIELCRCVLSFGVWEHYPKAAERQSHPFYYILNWVSSGGKYSKVGRVVMVGFPGYCMSQIVGGEWREESWEGVRKSVELVGQTLVVPSALYVWHQLAVLCMVVSNWREPKRTGGGEYDDGVFAYCGRLSQQHSSLLRSALLSTMLLVGLSSWKTKLSQNEVFWVNMMQRTSVDLEYEQLEVKESKQLEELVRKLVEECYGGEVTLEGYGFIVNPVHSRTQAWHLDYSPDYSTVFIPMADSDPLNATQYLVYNPELQDDLLDSALKDVNHVDVDLLLQQGGYLCLRQLLVRSYSLLKMDFGAIHRGIANAAPFERNVFYFSVVKDPSKVYSEPLFADFFDDKNYGKTRKNPL